ncbi:transglutaminase-like domain-containing protein [Desulfosarcina cetonica]|uniref:transglutaminase-like domain-containing protein n=1 Tax=Desulfosarcina cetonica TaxID=90730 RepID=UPI001C4633D7
MNPSLSEFLKFTSVIDGHHPHVSAFAHQHADGVTSVREQAVRLFYAVRDGIRYDPYSIDLTPAGMRASHTLAAGRAWCVPKAILLAACCRVMKIPAKLGFADVVNHLATERLKKMMNTNVFSGTVIRPSRSTESGSKPHRPLMLSYVSVFNSTRLNLMGTATPFSSLSIF